MKQKIKKAIKSRTGKLIIGLISVVLVLGGLLFFIKTNNRVNTDMAQVTAPIISVAPDASGRLINTLVEEGDIVKKGDVLGNTETGMLKAYSDGLIIKVNKQIGSFFNPQTPVVQMVNTNEIRISGEIDENKGLNKIKIGQVAFFTIDAWPGKKFWGFVDEVSPTAKQDQLSFSISNNRPTRQFLVYVKYDTNKYPEIKNGMSAKMTIFTK